MPTVRDLLKDPQAFTKFLEGQLNIPYKFAQILLAAHVKPSKVDAPRSWCERGRLAPVFIALDGDTHKEIEQTMCLTYYPTIVDELDRQIAKNVSSAAEQPTTAAPTNATVVREEPDWDRFLDQIVYVSRNLPQTSPDNAVFDAQTEFGQSLQSVRAALENPTTTNLLDA